jgi:uncharacterized damage-inducible protein DinB
MSTLPKLIDHLEWADTRALGALRAASDAPLRVRGIYAHILGSEHTWVSRIEGREPTVAIWRTLDDAQLARTSAENVAAFRRILDGATDVELTRIVAYKTSAGHPYKSTVEDILLHVALHGSYHRGQLAILLRQNGSEPVATDYILFSRDAPAASRASIPER